MTESPVTQNGLELARQLRMDSRSSCVHLPSVRVTGCIRHHAKMGNYYRGQIMELAHASVEAETL